VEEGGGEGWEGGGGGGGGAGDGAGQRIGEAGAANPVFRKLSENLFKGITRQLACRCRKLGAGGRARDGEGHRYSATLRDPSRHREDPDGEESGLWRGS